MNNSKTVSTEKCGQLNGRRAIIVGGAGGIGKGIVEALVCEGASVLVADKDGEKAQTVVNELGGAAVRARAATIDVCDESSVREVFSTFVAEMGGIDILVNCAGVIKETPVYEIPLEEWNWVIGVNLTGVFICCQAVLPYMKEQGGGRIINIASQIGQRGGTRLAHYSATKAGVIGLTKSLAREVSKEGILVNAVAPGPVNTGFDELLSAETLASTTAGLPLGKRGIPEEIAPSVVLLASSPGGDLYVGQTLGPNSGDVML